MVETRVFPQDLNIAFANEAAFPDPDTTSGLPLFDLSVNALKFTDGSGGFRTALPQHTTSGAHGPKVTITQTSADNALVLTQNFGAAALSVQCGSTGSGAGIDVVSVSNTTQAVRITANGIADALRIDPSTGNAITTVNGNIVMGPGNLVVGNGTLTVDTNTLVTTSTGRVGVKTTSPDRTFDVNGGAAFRGNHIFLTNPSAPVGKRAWGLVVNTSTGVLSLGRATDTLPAGGTLSTSTLQIHPSAPANSFYINSSGNTGFGTSSPFGKVEIESTGGEHGLLVDKISGTGNGLYVQTRGGVGGGFGIRIDNSTDEEALYIQQRITGADCAIQVDNSATQASLQLNHAGAGGSAIDINVTGASTLPAIDIQNNGTGFDLEGTNNTWHITKSGEASFINTLTKCAYGETGVVSNGVTVTVNFASGTSTSGTYTGDTSFSQAPCVLISWSDTGLQSNTSHHRQLFTISSLTSSLLSFVPTYDDIGAGRLRWLAVGR